MKYSVVWKPFAEYQLADIWLRAADQQAVTDASDTIDRRLHHNPERLGEADVHGMAHRGGSTLSGNIRGQRG